MVVGKIYRVIRPEQNDGPSLRVVDEEGEDYLYPPRRFTRVSLPRPARTAIMGS